MIANTMRMGTIAALVLSTASLAGCLGPTYGTGKSQGETLFDDLNNMVSLGTGGSDSEPIAYRPRTELVKPENTSILPQPQQPRPETSLVESPEQRRARLQAAAYQGDGPIPADVATARKEGVTQDYLDRTTGAGYDFRNKNNRDEAGVLSPEAMQGRGELMRERLAASRQGRPDVRRTLSEPPLDYRKPAASAPVGEVGVDEEVKQRRLQGTESLGTKIRNALPF